MKKRYIIAGTLAGWLLYPTHHIYMGHSGSYSFELYLFISILVLGYLLCLKLTSYLADFKDIKHRSRIEIIFLTVFFVLLFIPMSNISKADISEHENRRLAKYQPVLTDEGKLNLTFGKDFDSWFNDRFFLRNNLIDLFYKLKMINTVVEVNSGIYNQKTHWMFAKAHLDYSLQNLDKKSVLNTFEKLNEFCTNNNIKLYVLIVPYAVDIYQAEAYPYINPYLKQTNYDTVKQLQKMSDVKIIFPFDELKKESRKNYVYYKTEHHWTDTGAYLGYKELMKTIRKDYPNVKMVSLNDYDKSYSKMVRGDFDRRYDIGQTFKNNIPLSKSLEKKVLTTDYAYYDHKDRNSLKLEVVNIPYHRGKNTYYPNGNNLRVIELGTSMNENLLGFTQYTFKNLKYIRVNSVKGREESEQYKVMKYYKDDILQYKPDILIFCITTGNLGSIRDLFKE